MITGTFLKARIWGVFCVRSWCRSNKLDSNIWTYFLVGNNGQKIKRLILFERKSYAAASRMPDGVGPDWMLVESRRGSGGQPVVLWHLSAFLQRSRSVGNAQSTPWNLDRTTSWFQNKLFLHFWCWHPRVLFARMVRIRLQKLHSRRLVGHLSALPGSVCF